jgi:hypothetical protein
VKAADAFRAAIAQQKERHESVNEVRLSDKSVCDFCAAEDPVWYYRSPEIALNIVTGEAGILTDPAGGTLLHRFDTGWLACDRCMPLIEAEDGDALLARWRENEIALYRRNFRSAEALREVRIRMGRVHKVFFAHKRGPERIRET